MTLDDIFVREDLSKLENRINVSLFGLMLLDDFRHWFLERLSLPVDSVLYPPRNISTDEGSGRPDFVVKSSANGETLAWIEVECWSNARQLGSYRRTYRERIIALWGKPGPECDLSLQDVAEFLDQRAGRHGAQVRQNMKHLRSLIAEIETYGSTRSTRTASVGDEMRNSHFIAALQHELGEMMSFYVAGEGAMSPGRIRVDTTDTLNNRGFSVGVYTPMSKKDRRVSILNRSGGRPTISFSSRAWLRYYLPGHPEAIQQWTDLARRLGADIEGMDPGSPTNARPAGNKMIGIPLAIAEQHAQAIAAGLKLLARRPQT